MFRGINGLTVCALALCAVPVMATAESGSEETAAAMTDDSVTESISPVADLSMQADASEGATSSTEMTGAFAKQDLGVEGQESTPTGSDQGKRTSGGSRLIEEVIVTAQMREEALQDVPISVSAFSAEALDARGVTDMNDMTRVTPGLNVSQQAGFTLIYIRGVGANAFITADPSVVYYVDGVYIPASQGMGEMFSDIERIEILKGPQGTLFGRNAVGGAINVVTKAPSLTAKSGYLVSDYNFTYDQIGTNLYANVPVTDTVAASASVGYKTGDHWLDVTHDQGRPLDRQSERNARLRLRWVPSEDFEANVVAYWGTRLKAGTLVSVIVNPTTLGTLIGAEEGADADPRKPNLSAPLYSTKYNHLIAGNTVYNTDWFDLKAFASTQFFKMPEAGFDFDGTSKQLLYAHTGDYTSRGHSYELQLASNATSWGADWLTWIAGAYYYKDRQGFNTLGFGAAGIDFTGATGNNTNLPPLLIDAINAGLTPFGMGAPNGEVLTRGLIGKESQALYGQATIDFTDWVSLTLGARYTAEDLKILTSKTGIAGEPSHDPDLDQTWLIEFENGSDGKNHHKFTSLKPKVALDFHPFGEGTMLYVSYQEAFKSANYNTVNIYLPPKYVDPEEIRAYEAGIKTTVFDGTTQINAAIFDYKINNLQVQYLSVFTGGVINLENAGSVGIRGFDLDVISALFPNYIDGLVLALSGAFLDGEYLDYDNASGYPGNIGILTRNNDFSGNTVERNPRWSGTMALSKTWEVPGGSIEVGGDVYYSGKIYFSPSNSEESEQKAYTQLGARVSYMYDAWDLRISGYGVNINDADYALGKMQFDFGQFTTLAPLHSYGIKVQWDF